MNKGVEIIKIFVLLIIFFTILKTQLYLSKKENKYYGLIFPIIILFFSIFLAFGFTPTETRVVTTEAVVGETKESESTPTRNDVPLEIDSGSSGLGILSTFFIINIGTILLLSIYFVCRSKQNRSIELKKMRASEL